MEYAEPLQIRSDWYVWFRLPKLSHHFCDARGIPSHLSDPPNTNPKIRKHHARNAGSANACLRRTS